MQSQKHNIEEGNIRKNFHDIRSHLSVILSASELAVLDEAALSREAAVAVIKSTMKEVEEIIHILQEIERSKNF